MSNLMEFLLENPVGEITDEVVISERLKDYKFKIKAMSNDEFNDMQSRYTKITKKGTKLDVKAFNNAVALDFCIEPDFRKEETIKKAGVHSAEQLLNKVLLAGEVSALVNKITELSGFTSVDEDIEEAKN